MITLARPSKVLVLGEVGSSSSVEMSHELIVDKLQMKCCWTSIQLKRSALTGQGLPR